MKNYLGPAVAGLALAALLVAGAMVWFAPDPAAPRPAADLGPVPDEVIDEILARGRTDAKRLADPIVRPQGPIVGGERRVVAAPPPTSPSEAVEVSFDTLRRQCPAAVERLRRATIDGAYLGLFQRLGYYERAMANEAFRDWAICESFRRGGYAGCEVLDGFATLQAEAASCRQETAVHRTGMEGARQYLQTGRIDVKPSDALQAAYAYQLETVFGALNDREADECKQRVGAHLPAVYYTCLAVSEVNPGRCATLANPADRFLCLNYVTLFLGLPMNAEKAAASDKPYVNKLFRDMIEIFTEPEYDCREVLAAKYEELCAQVPDPAAVPVRENPPGSQGAPNLDAGPPEGEGVPPAPGADGAVPPPVPAPDKTESGP